MSSTDFYIIQHKQRLCWMPWLYESLKERHMAWVKPWQDDIQQQLIKLETVSIGFNCFVAENAKLFGEPGRGISVGDGVRIAAECFLHGPLIIGNNVSINPRVVIDGGKKGVTIGANSRIATGVTIFAFNHCINPGMLVREQGIESRGIVIGEDVWIGAQAGITDGVRIGNHAVVGMSAVVTHDVPDWAIVAGSPARVIGDRRTKR